jgi:hypothetical protein
LPWRRFALDSRDKDQPKRDEEVHNILTKLWSSSKLDPEIKSEDEDRRKEKIETSGDCENQVFKGKSFKLEIIKSVSRFLPREREFIDKFSNINYIEKSARGRNHHVLQLLPLLSLR